MTDFKIVSKQLNFSKHLKTYKIFAPPVHAAASRPTVQPLRSIALLHAVDPTSSMLESIHLFTGWTSLCNNATNQTSYQAVLLSTVAVCRRCSLLFNIHGFLPRVAQPPSIRIALRRSPKGLQQHVVYSCFSGSPKTCSMAAGSSPNQITLDECNRPSFYTLNDLTAHEGFLSTWQGPCEVVFHSNIHGTFT
eukprot:Gb_01999 [translate_table: standard]